MRNVLPCGGGGAPAVEVAAWVLWVCVLWV